MPSWSTQGNPLFVARNELTHIHVNTEIMPIWFWNDTMFSLSLPSSTITKAISNIFALPVHSFYVSLNPYMRRCKWMYVSLLFSKSSVWSQKSFNSYSLTQNYHPSGSEQIWIDCHCKRANFKESLNFKDQLFLLFPHQIFYNELV